MGLGKMMGEIWWSSMSYGQSCSRRSRRSGVVSSITQNVLCSVVIVVAPTPSCQDAALPIFRITADLLYVNTSNDSAQFHLPRSPVPVQTQATFLWFLPEVPRRGVVKQPPFPHATRGPRDMRRVHADMRRKSDGSSSREAVRPHMQTKGGRIRVTML